MPILKRQQQFVLTPILSILFRNRQAENLETDGIEI